MATVAVPEVCCSFCTTAKSGSNEVIAGPGVYICGDCVTVCTSILDNRPAPEQKSLLRWEGLSDDELLAALPQIAAVANQVEANLRMWVQRVRERGVTWTRIGEALGMARQSAWERFSGEE